MNIVLLITAPTGLKLDLPPPDAKGNPTATPQQEILHTALVSIDAQWQGVGVNGASTLFVVGTRSQSLAQIEAMILQFKLPLVVLHAQDAFAVQPTPPMQVDPMAPVAKPAPVKAIVYKQGTVADVLPFMPDIVTHNAAMQETGRTKASVVTLPKALEQADWELV